MYGINRLVNVCFRSEVDRNTSRVFEEVRVRCHPPCCFAVNSPPLLVSDLHFSPGRVCIGPVVENLGIGSSQPQRSPSHVVYLAHAALCTAIDMAANGIQYSERYYDDVYEYRHVVLPPEITKKVPKGRLMSETEWRSLGVQQSRGWVHYAIHRPEPHILLYRRPKGYGQPAGTVPMQQ